jgi:heme exporter protein B
MPMISFPIINLLNKEITLEWRHKFAFNGVLLYVVSAVFVCFLSFGRLADTVTWNALFWLIILFASVNAVLKSFLQERETRQIYYYTLASARDIIISKIIYNAFLLTLLSVAGFFIFILLMGNPIENLALFLVNMILGVLALSSVLSMVSAIASRARNNFTLMAVLSFPLILPLILIVLRNSVDAANGEGFVSLIPGLLVILLLIAITIVLSVILFPFIWKE